MASLIIHTQGFYKAPLPQPLIKFDKSKLSTVNCKKKRVFFSKNLIKAMLKDHNDVERDNYYSKSMILRDSDNSCVDYSDAEERRILQPAPYQSASNLQSCQRFMEGILEMSRLQNFVPTTVLVLVGGWLGGGHSVEALLRPGQMWIAVWCSSLITVAAMLFNDIFDFRAGTDQADGKTNPLLRGQIHPYHVELVAFCLYGASIIGLCYLEPMSLRLLIGIDIVATYFYTPILKNITMVKNMVVSGIISTCVLVGALATGGEEQLQNPIITTIALFVFLCFLSREILMDVGDMVGDKATGVNTLAVRFGGHIGTLTASVCLAAANALLISLLVVKAQEFATVGTLILLPLHAKMLSLCKELGATKDDLTVNSIHQVVQQSMVHIGFGVLFLAFVA